MSNRHISVVVPAFNESGTLVFMAQSLHSVLQQTGQTIEIIIVDDGSTDASRQVLETISVPVIVISNPVNRGKGYALRCGIARASGDVIAYIDADMSLSPLYLTDMLNMISKDCDIVIASRFLNGGRKSDTDSRFRTYASKFFALTRTLILGESGHKDTQCGLKMMTSTVKNKIISHCLIDGYGFDSEFLFLARQNNFKIEEIPVDLATTGKDKRYAYWLYQGVIVFRDLWRIRINWWLNRYD